MKISYNGTNDPNEALRRVLEESMELSEGDADDDSLRDSGFLF
jgi:hypothetical protein